MNSREVIRRLEVAGWVEVAQKGSNKQFRHPAKSGHVTVVHPKKDFSLGTLRSMETQSGLRLR